MAEHFDREIGRKATHILGDIQMIRQHDEMIAALNPATHASLILELKEKRDRYQKLLEADQAERDKWKEALAAIKGQPAQAQAPAPADSKEDDDEDYELLHNAVAQ